MSELKLGWRRMKFGELAECVNVRVDDPSKAGVDRYVGLEHIDPECLSIKRWGSPDDVESTKLRFWPGDIIFGKRRSYQRKLAIADFNGICSAHAMVLRAKSTAVWPEYLPFLMMSDVFMNRAIAISVGSLSPTINWKTLANEHFELPSMADQRCFSEILRQSYVALDQAIQLKEAAIVLLESLLIYEFSRIKKFTQLQSVSKPIVRGIDSPGPDIPDGIPYVRIAEMTGPEGILVGNLRRTSTELAASHPESTLEEGDFVVALRGVVGMPVRVPKEVAGANLSRGTARLSINKNHNSNFYFYALKSPSVRKEILKNCTGWKGEDLREITLGALRELLVPSLERDSQDKIAEQLIAAESAVQSAGNRILETRAILKALLADMTVGSR